MIHGESYEPIAAEAAKKAVCGEDSHRRIFEPPISLGKNGLRDKRASTAPPVWSGLFGGGYAIAPCVDTNRLALG